MNNNKSLNNKKGMNNKPPEPEIKYINSKPILV